MTGYVTMLASQKNGTIYTGVTSDLGRRIPEHKAGTGSRFTARYGVVRLVWYEEHFDIRDAIEREKRVKRWRRDWKRRAPRSRERSTPARCCSKAMPVQSWWRRRWYRHCWPCVLPTRTMPRWSGPRRSASPI